MGRDSSGLTILGGELVMTSLFGLFFLTEKIALIVLAARGRASNTKPTSVTHPKAETNAFFSLEGKNLLLERLETLLPLD
jgi:hypothetical protein